MNWEGRYLVIGFAAGEIPKIPLNLTLLKGCDVLGVFWGMATQRDPKHANESLREIMQMISDGKLASRRVGEIPAGGGRQGRSACSWTARRWAKSSSRCSGNTRGRDAFTRERP